MKHPKWSILSSIQFSCDWQITTSTLHTNCTVLRNITIYLYIHNFNPRIYKFNLFCGRITFTAIERNIIRCTKCLSNAVLVSQQGRRETNFYAHECLQCSSFTFPELAWAQNADNSSGMLSMERKKLSCTWWESNLDRLTNRYFRETSGPSEIQGYSKRLSVVLTTCHFFLQMQPHVIYFYWVTSTIRFIFLLFPQVFRNWWYESEPPLKPSPLTCYKQFGTNSIIVLMFIEPQSVHI